eukprot:snap_masked-scaffold_25-processed-gene-1.5-mRNA-1 protein AED:1.00 eAED:1.00 QI:0/-1/0/0/-1/1/1/0/197
MTKKTNVGKLKLKIQLKKNKKKKSKKRKLRSRSIESESSAYSAEEVAVPVRIKGIGSITASGVVVSGTNTKFKSQFSTEDVIIIKTDPQEARVVHFIASDTSLQISEPFEGKISSLIEYEVLQKPREKTKKSKQNNFNAEEAFGTYKTEGETVTLRVRKGGKNSSGGYKLIKKKHKDMSREELLDLRCKLKGDRNCM